MPASKISRLSRLRSHATGENRAAASQALKNTSPTVLIIPAPAPGQEQLEGVILEKMNGLRLSPQTAGLPPFGIRRVIPATDLLVIELEHGSGFDEFVHNVMPVIQQPDDSDHGVHGVPVLRVRSHNKGISLFRPGLEGEVVLAGIRPSEWEAAHEAGFYSPHVGCAATSNPTEWTPTEKNRDSWFLERFGAQALRREQEANILRSALFRRIGLINRLNPQGANTWAIAGQDGGLAVEIFEPENEASNGTFIEEMTSPLMPSPLTCTYFGSSLDRLGGTFRFTTPRSAGYLEIRITGGR